MAHSGHFATKVLCFPYLTDQCGLICVHADCICIDARASRAK